MVKKASQFLSIFFLLVILSSGVSLSAAEGKLGAGFILGDPTGITGKYYVSSADALDFGLGASYGDGFYLYCDYLRHFPGVFPVRELALYLGGGGGFHHHDSDSDRNHHKDEYNSLECRVPLGVEYTLDKAPLGIFAEIVPALQVIPDIESDIRGGIGIRYYF